MEQSICAEEDADDDDDDWNPGEQLGAEEEELQQQGNSEKAERALALEPTGGLPVEPNEHPVEVSAAVPGAPEILDEVEVSAAVPGAPEILDEAGMVALQEAATVAEQEKTRGNRLFQEGKFHDSVEAYKRGAGRVENAVPSRLLTPEAQKLLVALYCNGAQASLKCTDDPDVCTNGACTMAERALALEPTNVKALFRRGLAYANAEDWEMACDDYAQAFKLDPGNEAVHRELQKAQGKLGVAKTPPPPKKVTQRPLQTPEDAMIIAKESKDRGTALFQSQQFWAAYEAFKSGADVLESDIAPCSGILGKEAVKLKVGLCNNAAMSALKCNEINNASTELAHLMAEKVLELEPENVKALFRRGLADANAGCLQMARQDFEAVLSLDPLNKEALRELQKIDARTGASGADAVAADAVVDSAGDAALPQLKPGEVCKLVLERLELLREQIRAAAEAQNCSLVWSQRLNKLQLQTVEWAKHQLADPEMSEDLNIVNGPLFAAMDEQQKEDFVMAYEFETELKRQYSTELGALLGIAATES